MFDYKKYVEPVQKWLKELEILDINEYGDEVECSVSFEIYQTISELVEDYIYRMEHDDE